MKEVWTICTQNQRTGERVTIMDKKEFTRDEFMEAIETLQDALTADYVIVAIPH